MHDRVEEHPEPEAIRYNLDLLKEQGELSHSDSKVLLVYRSVRTLKDNIEALNSRIHNQPPIIKTLFDGNDRDKSAKKVKKAKKKKS